MLKLGRVTKFKMLFLVLVFVFNFDLFKFSAAILEKGLLEILRHYFFSVQEVFVKATICAHASLTYPLMIYFILTYDHAGVPFFRGGKERLIIFYRVLLFYLSNDSKLNSLIYADDLIILSRSKAGLQNWLNTLAQYCRSWMLNIKPKNEFMIFQRRAKKYDCIFLLITKRLTLCTVILT